MPKNDNEIFYFLHPYYTNDGFSELENMDKCMEYVKELNELGFYVYVPTIFFHLLAKPSNYYFQMEDLRNLDSRFLEKMDGLIISPYYENNKEKLRNIIQFFKLKELPIYKFSELVEREYESY